VASMLFENSGNLAMIFCNRPVPYLASLMLGLSEISF
jgi:hypothetical protein